MGRKRPFVIQLEIPVLVLLGTFQSVGQQQVQWAKRPFAAQFVLALSVSALSGLFRQQQWRVERQRMGLVGWMKRPLAIQPKRPVSASSGIFQSVGWQQVQ